MKLNIDSQSLEFPCQACGKKLSQTIGRLKKDPDLTCTCGAVTHVDRASLNKGITQIEKSLSDLQRKLGKMFK